MNTVEVIDEKINLLKNAIKELDLNTSDEKEKIEKEITIIEDCQEIFNDENLLCKYDFTEAINLLNKYDFTITNLLKILTDIQTAITIKHELDLDDLPLSSNQDITLKTFLDSLSKIKNNLQEKIEELRKNNDSRITVSNLELLKRILEEKGRRKYYTYDMLEAFYEVIDWDTLSPFELKSILEGLYNTRNLKGKKNKEPVEFEDIVTLYKEYLNENEFKKSSDDKYIGLFGNLLRNNEEEIKTFIDLENTREILQFFKNENILDKFGRNALLKVSVFGKIDYIKKLYKEIMEQRPNELEMYFENEAATLWVCEKSAHKKKPFRISRPKNEFGDTKPTLYSQCHSVTDKEFRENVQLLNKNSDLFADKYDVTNFGAHLKAKMIPKEQLKEFKSILNLVTSSSWSFRKNLGLCRLFGFGTISKIPMSCLDYGDIEDKIHLAIELDLLNPPINDMYIEMEKDIVRGEEFQKIVSKKGLYNQSIRNYFQRYTSYLSKLTINDYAYLTYKLYNKGPLGFYNEFFSNKKAGQRNIEFLTDKEKEIISTKEKIDKLISENFLQEFYSDFVDNYYEYDNVIEDYDESDKENYYMSQNNYFDSSILEDDLIKTLEDEHGVMDTYHTNDGIKEVKNEFIYIFGSRIISRMKVLHNATILKNTYGYLDKNMLLASIVRKSFINENDFIIIQEAIKKGGKEL